MAFEELKEQWLEQWQQSKEKIQDSALYQQLKERYDDLPPKQQKILQISGLVIICYLVLSIPLGSLQQASDNISQYFEVRATLQQLRDKIKEKDELPQSNAEISGMRMMSSLKALLEKEGLGESQISQTENFEETNTGQFAGVPTEAKISGLRWQLKQLNLRQITNITFTAQRQLRPAKITKLHIQPTPDKAGFFDLSAEARIFALPVTEEMAESEETDSKKGRRKNRK